MKGGIRIPIRLRAVFGAALGGAVIIVLASACEPFSVGQKAFPPAPAALRAVTPISAEGQDSALHDDCQACHIKDNQIVTGKPMPVIPHEVTGWEQCSFCHTEGRLAPMPVGHSGTTDGQCQTCHKPSAKPAPRMGHLVFADKTCTSCHGEKVALPANHSERATYTCELCHTPAKEAPPPAPHAAVQGQACANCHGKQGSLALPASHAERNDQLCILCHQEQRGGTPEIPHSIENRGMCIECHTPGSETSTALGQVARRLP